MILSDLEIIELSTNTDKPLIESFIARSVNKLDDGQKALSYGTSSYGYDLRSGFEYKIFTNEHSGINDPKNLDDANYITIDNDNVGDYILIPPNGFMLTYALEKLNMPRDITGVVIGKSTYARVGLNCICTPAEAGWSGHLTLEFSNTTPLPTKFYVGEGCCQILFFKGNNCSVSYEDRNGKYQHQGPLVTLPKV